MIFRMDMMGTHACVTRATSFHQTHVLTQMNVLRLLNCVLHMDNVQILLDLTTATAR